MEPEHLESLYPADSRKKEIQEILSFIKAGKSCQLIALPGIGRGNLLGFLAFNHNVRTLHLGEKEQESYHFVLANFSEVKDRPLFDVMKFLYLELVSSLHERRREEEFLVVDKMFKDALSYQDELVLFQSFKDAIGFLALEKNLHIIFLFERFETYISTLTEAFFTNLRSIRARAKYKFSVVFSLTRPLEDILESSLFADFYEFIADNHVYLSLKDTIGTSFRIEYLEKLTGKKLLQQTIDEILQLTGGHGKLTRLAFEVALSTTKIDDLQTFLLSQKTIKGALFEIWNFLTPDEQNDVFALCKKENITNEFLKQIGLVNNDHIAIPLFEEFVKENLKKEATTEQHISYDSSLDIFTKGHQAISDLLTRSEIKLLKLLFDKKESIVTREEIIQAVWSDTKTQEGVSEQAIDQLLFRLRKKIEDDPNTPQHIQTVKGRGIHFIP